MIVCVSSVASSNGAPVENRLRPDLTMVMSFLGKCNIREEVYIQGNDYNNEPWSLSWGRRKHRIFKTRKG